MWDEERAEEEEKRRDRADFQADRKREDEWAEKIPIIEIPCILWKKRAVGVALSKLRAGLNIIKVTAKNKEGWLYYPRSIVVHKDTIVENYGIEIINQKGLRGIWLPLDLFETEEAINVG